MIHHQKGQRIMNGEDKILGSFQLGMEIPTVYMSWFEPYQDFLICLAHEVKENPMYAAWHLRQSVAKDRFVILDNGSHEKGLPMMDEELAEAALMCGATLVVAPDFLENREATVRETINFSKKYEDDIDVMGVCQGETVGEMIQCFLELMDSPVKMIGFPYKLNRLQAIRDLADNKALDSFKIYSLLGFNSFQELHQIGALGPWTWMLDTEEPIQAALAGVEIMPHYEPLRKVHNLSASFSMSDAQLYLATLNVSKFKVYLPTVEETAEVSPIGESE